KKVLNVAKEFLNSKNIFIHEYMINGKPSFVATMKKTKTPDILLNGHLDVVPGTSNQFIPEIKGDKLIGRGAQDMKASCAAMLTVFKNLSEDETFPKDRLGIMIVTDEEIGGFSGTSQLLKK